MDQQNTRTLSLLASTGLAASGAVIFIAESALVASSAVPGVNSLLLLWVAFLALIAGFL